MTPPPPPSSSSSSSPIGDAAAERLAGKPKAVILLSGGLDSATTLYMAAERGYECYTLSFHYEQRHQAELNCAEWLSDVYNTHLPHKVVNLGQLLQARSSALTTPEIDVPTGRSDANMGSDIPVTYVPGRNILFLSYAAGYAEHIGAQDIFIGVNVLDYSGYPDCRGPFITAFEEAINLGMKKAVEGNPYNIHTPLLEMTKTEIIQEGLRLGVPYEQTSSCYQPTAAGYPCGKCDSCILRAKGFKEAGSPDPLLI